MFLDRWLLLPSSNEQSIFIDFPRCYSHVLPFIRIFWIILVQPRVCHVQNPFNHLRKPALAWAPGLWISLEWDQSLCQQRQLPGGTDWIGHFVYPRGTWVRRTEHWKTRPWNLTFCSHLSYHPFPFLLSAGVAPQGVSPRPCSQAPYQPWLC